MMRKVLPLLLFLCIQNLHIVNAEITHREAGAFTTGGFNRSSYGFGEIAMTGALELNNRYSFRGGFLFEFAKPQVGLKLFTAARIAPWKKIPLRFSLAYMYAGLPKYEAHANTLMPSVMFSGKWAGIAIGVSFRFTRFFKESAIFEPILSISAYVNFYTNEKFRIGITAANFNDFGAGNMGSYSLSINSAVNITERWSIFNDLEVMQSGSVGLSSNFYGIAWRGGMKFVW